MTSEGPSEDLESFFLRPNLYSLFIFNAVKPFLHIKLSPKSNT